MAKMKSTKDAAKATAEKILTVKSLAEKEAEKETVENNLTEKQVKEIFQDRSVSLHIAPPLPPKETKVALNSFGTLPQPTSKDFKINNITFKCYTTKPYVEILSAIQWIIVLTTTDNGFISYPNLRICEEILLVHLYTNINVSRIEKAGITQGELYEIYDFLTHHGILPIIRGVISPEQLSFYHDTLYKTIESINTYRNSAAGMVELITSRSEDQSLKFEEIFADLQDPEKMGTMVKIAELVQQKNDKTLNREKP